MQATQVEFSIRLGITPRTLARYELEQPPKSGRVLAKLADLADDNLRPDLKEVFDRASEIARTPTVIARAIRGLRRHLGDTQQQFAERVGVSPITITRYEIDARASTHNLVKLARVARENGLHEYADVLEGNRNPDEIGNEEKTLLLDHFQRVAQTSKLRDYRQVRCATAVLQCPDRELRKLESILAPQLAIIDEFIEDLAGHMWRARAGKASQTTEREKQKIPGTQIAEGARQLNKHVQRISLYLDQLLVGEVSQITRDIEPLSDLDRVRLNAEINAAEDAIETYLAETWTRRDTWHRNEPISLASLQQRTQSLFEEVSALVNTTLDAEGLSSEERQLVQTQMEATSQSISRILDKLQQAANTSTSSPTGDVAGFNDRAQRRGD